MEIHSIPAGDECKREENRWYYGQELHVVILLGIYLRLISIPYLLGIFQKLRCFTHQSVCTVRDNTEIFHLFLGKETIFILFELFSHVHDLIIITAECQKFTSDRHDRILESLDLSVHDTFFQIHDPFLIMSQKFQIPAYEFQHKIINEFFFRFSLSRLLPLNSADQTVRKFIIVHNHDMMTVNKK